MGLCFWYLGKAIFEKLRQLFFNKLSDSRVGSGAVVGQRKGLWMLIFKGQSIALTSSACNPSSSSAGTKAKYPQDSGYFLLSYRCSWKVCFCVLRILTFWKMETQKLQFLHNYLELLHLLGMDLHIGILNFNLRSSEPKSDRYSSS